jgi:hypothetical protein
LQQLVLVMKFSDFIGPFMQVVDPSHFCLKKRFCAVEAGTHR